MATEPKKCERCGRMADGTDEKGRAVMATDGFACGDIDCPERKWDEDTCADCRKPMVDDVCRNIHCKDSPDYDPGDPDYCASRDPDVLAKRLKWGDA